MRDILSDWTYLVSADNKKSRGFYLSLLIACIITLVVMIVAFVLVLIGRISAIALLFGGIAFVLSWGPAVYLSLKS